MSKTKEKAAGLSERLTRDGILGALAEYDELGADAFHAKHGTAPSAKYSLRHGGKTYPSKAIVAAAAKMTPKGFSGGKARLGKMLARMGFTLGALAFMGTASKVVAYAAPAHAASELATPDDTIDTTYFASGSSRPAQIKGFAAIGQAIGVTAPELSPKGENALHALAGTGVQVFVDSGAFSEVDFTDSGPVVVKAITDDEWRTVLDLYARLALSLGNQLFVVAPDMVGFQGATLARLERWKDDVRSLVESGANVIVVAQKGERDQADFDREVEKVLGTSDYVRGLPCNKNATSTEAIGEFAAARKPARLHLLGLGLRNERALDAAKLVAEVSPDTVLSLDSCLITESVGTKNGRISHPMEKKGGNRIFTWAKTKAKALIESGRSMLELEELAIHLAWGPDQLSMC